MGYRFRDPSLLERALTHSSYGNERMLDKTENNERLEFLGDAVFDAIISEYLYRRLEQVEEGRLTRYRSMVVRERSLSECGIRLGLNRHIRLGRGEELSDGSLRSSIIADAMEAVIAAIYLDGGLAAAEEFVLRAFGPTLEAALSGGIYIDYKTRLQEQLQTSGPVDIRYQMDKEEGPDHAKIFTISLWVNGTKRGTGTGRTKKEAEQHAAKAALEVAASVF
ncbi:MAG: ribonuclease III [Firmicutes bacterium HGW-Firmicutes-11]|nr:MAG: ribonuclease III [Firmicutes bacterium HGW-Firmicutes-11]